MKMRKIISFVLTLALVLGSFSMAFAATPADVVGTPNEEAVQVLMGLGVVDGYVDGSFKPERIVSRAEMAKLIVVALGLKDYAQAGTTSYPDMVGAGWAEGYVSYATSLGIVEGYPDGTFKPSANVSYAEVATMIVRALGYTDASLLPATWPANYVVKAKALGILDGIKTSALGANRGDVAEMLYNALRLAIGSVDAENKWYANSVDADAPDNMLTRLGAEMTTDMVYGTEDTLINLVTYTGAFGDIYEIDDEIIAVDVTSDVIVGTYVSVDGAVNASTSDDTDYTITPTLASATGSAFFFNGAEYDIKNVVGTATGEYIYNVELSGKTIVKVHSIAEWDVTQSDLFVDTDAYDIEDDQKLLGLDFSLDADDNIDANQFMLLGAASLADIDVDDVVYVYATSDSAMNIKKIAVGTEVITGKVTERDDTDYTIGGKVYNISGETSDTLTVGDTVTARLDYFGDIYDVEVDSSTPDMYGVVLNKTTSGFDNIVKIYISDDAEKSFVYDLDSTSPSNATAITTGALTAYSLDKDGVIDAVTVTTSRAVTTVEAISSKLIMIDSITYGVDSDIVVFAVTGLEYEVVQMADVETGKNIIATNSYYVVEDGYVVAIIIDAAKAGATSDDNYGVFNNVTKVPDADDEIVQMLYGFIDGSSVAKIATANNVIGPFKTTIQAFNVTLNSSGEITATTTTGVTKVINNVVITDLTSDNMGIKTGDSTWSAVADDAVVYVAKLDGTEYVYTVANLSDLRKGYNVTLFDTDATETGAEIVVLVK